MLYNFCIKALQALPEELFIKQTRTVLEAAVDKCVSHRYQCQVQRKLAYQDYLQTTLRCMEGAKHYVKVDECKNCKICHRKIGDKRFVI